MPCISLPTAMLIGGGLSAAGGVASAVIGSGAAKSAAQTQAQAAQTASEQQRQMFEETRQTLSPFVSAGTATLPELKNLLGLGSGGTAGIIDTLKQLPGYQFALQQGLQATQNSFAAQGLGSSGAAMKGAANYAEGLAGETYNELFSNLMSTAGLGENAAALTGQIGMGTQNSISNLLTGSAAATAAGTIGSANAITGGINSAIGGITNSLYTPLMWNALKQGGLYGSGG